MSESNMIPLASTTLANSDSSMVSFTGIANGASAPNYERLKLVFSLRGGWSGSSASWLRMRVGKGTPNTGSWYQNVYMFGSGNSTPNIYTYTAQSDWTVGYITGSDSTYGWMHGSVDVLDWWAASNNNGGGYTKLIGAEVLTYGAGDATGITDSTMYKSGHRMGLSDAWSSLHFTLDSSWGTTNKFATGSTFDLYGVESAS